MTKKSSEESNEYHIPGTETEYWKGGLYFLPKRIGTCSHGNNALFLFEYRPNANGERLASKAQWCITCLDQPRYSHLIPIIYKFFEEHPELALEA